MQNAVAEQRAQNETLSGTTTISLRNTRAGGREQGRPEIEVIQEGSRKAALIDEAREVFCRDLLEFLGDFKSAAPKSSTVRSLGQAAAQDGPVARELAPHQDLLFDFLRAYEAAPKMRPLSQVRFTRGTPEPAGKDSGLTATPPEVAPPEDTPFRVPPYVSAVSENEATEEAALDPEAWLEPQPSSVPVVQPPVATPVPQPPVAEPSSQTPVARRPARSSGAKRPGAVPVVKPSDAVPVVKLLDAVPVVKRPAPVAVAERPEQAPPAQKPAPMAPAASSARAIAERRPEAKPGPAQVKKRPEPLPAPAPAPKPLGAAAARAKAIEEGLIV